MTTSPDSLMPRRLHVLACGVLALDLRALLKDYESHVSVEFLPGGLHKTPLELRRRVQESIDRVAATAQAEMIAIGYGVCGMGTAGLHSRNAYLAIPRVQDCIALFLGSDQAYRREFHKAPGTYYVSAGWVSEQTAPPTSAGNAGRTIESAGGCLAYEDLVAKYGKDNADAVCHFLDSWQRNYQRAAFIDTGVEGKERIDLVARRMARDFGWRYERLEGSPELLLKLVTRRASTDEILVVPPHHVTVFDAATRRLEARPVWEGEARADEAPFRVTLGGEAAQGSAIRYGLGIDAGGTYTDAVIFDFQADRVLAKAKALTTRWDFTVGIRNALGGIDAEDLARAELVAVSTTLATNAIVEGQGQKVGLLVMPPYGLFDGDEIDHRPLAVIAGRLEIDGSEIAPVDPAEVRSAALEMVSRQAVRAFAVTGYASHVNPVHEMQVKALVAETTGLPVTCGHEIADGVGYLTRARTAALNARIIPCLETFLADLKRALEAMGLGAPVMVVKSDGSLMRAEAALRRPVETILSGPAASVAGGRHLAGAQDALVVDMGGTTTDTALLRQGEVLTRETGATVGPWRTYVRALDLRTRGLGGDSEIAVERGVRTLGPRRVAPVAWLASRSPEVGRALDWIEAHLDEYRESTRGMDLYFLNPPRGGAALPQTERYHAVLTERPRSRHELACCCGSVSWRFVHLDAQERDGIVQRCGLTPTDLLHVTGRLALWDADAAFRLADCHARLAGMDLRTFAEGMLERVEEDLALEVLLRSLAEDADPATLADSKAGQQLIADWLHGNASGRRVTIALDYPLIGIGAPVGQFLPGAARRLGTEAIIPEHAEVANAVGAITSSVLVRRRIRIEPDDRGGYRLIGVADAPHFLEFQAANDHAVAELERQVRAQAEEAGSSGGAVHIEALDRTAPLAEGGEAFIARTLEGRLTARPAVAH